MNAFTCAVLNCSHTINYDEIKLQQSALHTGNALSQLDKRLEAELKIITIALEFYANPKVYDLPENGKRPILEDGGNVARQILHRLCCDNTQNPE